MALLDYSKSYLKYHKEYATGLPASSYITILNADDGHYYRLGSLNINNTGANSGVFTLVVIGKDGIEYTLYNATVASAAFSNVMIDVFITDLSSLALKCVVGTPPTDIKFSLDIIDYIV